MQFYALFPQNIRIKMVHVMKIPAGYPTSAEFLSVYLLHKDKFNHNFFFSLRITCHFRFICFIMETPTSRGHNTEFWQNYGYMLQNHELCLLHGVIS